MWDTIGKLGLGVLAFGKQILGTKAGRETGVVDVEKELARQMNGSWKDEYLLIIFSSPMLFQMLSIVIEMMTGWWKNISYIWTGTLPEQTVAASMRLAASDMFDVINGLSGPYQAILMTMVVTSFGTHVTRKVMAGKRNKVVDAIKEIRKSNGDKDE